MADRASLHDLPSRHALNKGISGVDDDMDLEEAILAEAHLSPDESSDNPIPTSTSKDVTPHVATHVGFVKPIFGPPTTKLAFARFLHAQLSHDESSRDVSLSPSSAKRFADALQQLQNSRDHPGMDKAAQAHEEAHGEKRIQKGHRHLSEGDQSEDRGNDDQQKVDEQAENVHDQDAHGDKEDGDEDEDTQQAYTAAKIKEHFGAKIATEAAKEASPSASVQKNGYASGGNGVARFQLDVPRNWHPPKLRGSGHYEDRPRVYIYDLPTPLVNCSNEAHAIGNYGAEARLPEVRLPFTTPPSPFVRSQEPILQSLLVPATHCLSHCKG